VHPFVASLVGPLVVASFVGLTSTLVDPTSALAAVASALADLALVAASWVALA